MSRLPRDLRFYTFAIPTAALAAWGYADSFNTFGAAMQNIKKLAKEHTQVKSPGISYDGLIMSSSTSRQNASDDQVKNDTTK